MKKNEKKLGNIVFGFEKFSENVKGKVHLTICFVNCDRVTENTFSSKCLFSPELSECNLYKGLDGLVIQSVDCNETL